MKRILIILSCWFLISCGDNEKDSNNDASRYKTEEEPSNVEVMQAKNANTISPALLVELKSIFTHYDTLYTGDYPFKIRIFIVYFSQTDQDCYITIQTSLYYDSSHLKGYALVSDKMVAFYNPEDECNKALVDITKLKKGNPDNFPDEKSDFSIHTTHDPSGKKYKIHSPDSLELVYTGYF